MKIEHSLDCSGAAVVLADQFRDGNVPAGMGNAPIVEAALAALPKSVTEVRLRADSALYEEKVLKLLVERNVGFVVSADMSPELRGAARRDENELGAGTMPSGKLGANAAWYRLNLLTFSLLSLLKQLALDDETHDARPKRLRLHVFAVAACVVRHARGLFARSVRRAFPRLEGARAHLADLVTMPAPA